jgi:hypothetical protein
MGRGVGINDFIPWIFAGFVLYAMWLYASGLGFFQGDDLFSVARRIGYTEERKLGEVRRCQGSDCELTLYFESSLLPTDLEAEIMAMFPDAKTLPIKPSPLLTYFAPTHNVEGQHSWQLVQGDKILSIAYYTDPDNPRRNIVVVRESQGQN